MNLVVTLGDLTATLTEFCSTLFPSDISALYISVFTVLLALSVWRIVS